MASRAAGKGGKPKKLGEICGVNSARVVRIKSKMKVSSF